MKIEITGQELAVLGAPTPVSEAAVAALRGNGAVTAGGLPTLLLVSLPLLPAAEIDVRATLAEAEAMAEAMTTGRVIFLLPAAAGLPMRRHPTFSAAMASALATVRTLAMRLAPGVLVNAVGVGAIGAPLVAGDVAMLGHASVKRPGTVDEVVAAVLFLADPVNTYTTGQMLCVDGGWSAGYGRSF
ncbi:MAG: SDR family oxidoreductase [Rhodobacteraceae bacterium]|nr:SDR family oxidoreductase [Paracoccaceae bacterium]